MSDDIPTEARDLDTIPEGLEVPQPVDIDQPGLAAMSNLIDTHLGAFLERQEKRDEEFRALVVDTLNEAMINRDQMNKIELKLEEFEDRLRSLERRAEKSHDA